MGDTLGRMGKRQIRRGMKMAAPRRQRPAPQRSSRPYPYDPSPSDQYVLTRDGREVTRGSEAEIWAWMHSNLGYSIDHALRHEGYTITPVEVASKWLDAGVSPSYKWAYDKGLAAGRELGNAKTTDPDGQADIRRMSRERFGLRRWMNNAAMNEYERVGESEGIRQRGGGADWQRGFFVGLRDTINAWAASNIHDYKRVESPAARTRPVRNAAAAPRVDAPIHQDVEFAVDDTRGEERIFKDGNEASAFAVAVAMARGEANIDVLVWSEEGARAYGGDDAVERYNEDPEASVFERYEVKVNFVGMVP